MKKDLTEIICVIDCSGSMYEIEEDTIGGYNSFIESQKQLPGEAYLTLINFNDKCKAIYENEPIQNVKPLDHSTYETRGTTALLDAVGFAIDSTGKRLSATDEENRPEKVIFAILTDGYENASEIYTYDKLKEMITLQQKEYSWEFIFLGANQDAIFEAGKLGIDAENAFNFEATRKGIATAFLSMERSVSHTRGR